MDSDAGGKSALSEGLDGCYEELAHIWMWAARAYAEKAAKMDAYTAKCDPSKAWSWDDAAVRASSRAARYARLAEKANATS